MLHAESRRHTCGHGGACSSPRSASRVSVDSSHRQVTAPRRIGRPTSPSGGSTSPRSWCVLTTIVVCFLTPRGVVLTPRGVVLTPRGVVLTPRGVDFTPRGVDFTPRGVEKKILNLKPHPPGGPDLTPRGAVSTPRGVRPRPPGGPSQSPKRIPGGRFSPPRGVWTTTGRGAIDWLRPDPTCLFGRSASLMKQQA